MLALLLSTLTGFLMLPDAQAHASLVSSDPLHGAQAASGLSTLSLRFDQQVEAAGANVTAGLDGGIRTARIEAVGTQLIARFDPPLPDGHVDLLWRVLSFDGHVTSDVIGFTLGNAPREAWPAAQARNDLHESASQTWRDATIVALALAGAGLIVASGKRQQRALTRAAGVYALAGAVVIMLGPSPIRTLQTATSLDFDSALGTHAGSRYLRAAIALMVGGLAALWRGLRTTPREGVGLVGWAAGLLAIIALNGVSPAAAQGRVFFALVSGAFVYFGARHLGARRPFGPAAVIVAVLGLPLALPYLSCVNGGGDCSSSATRTGAFLAALHVIGLFSLVATRRGRAHDARQATVVAIVLTITTSVLWVAPGPMPDLAQANFDDAMLQVESVMPEGIVRLEIRPTPTVGDASTLDVLSRTSGDNARAADFANGRIVAPDGTRTDLTFERLSPDRWRANSVTFTMAGSHELIIEHDGMNTHLRFDVAPTSGTSR